MDAIQQIAGINQGAEHIFGYAAGEIIGQPLAALLPRLSATERQDLTGLGAGPQAAGTSGEPVLVFGRRKDGSGLPAEARLSKLMPGGPLALTVMCAT